MTLENRTIHVAAERVRGDAALRAARELLALGLFSDAVSRAYYAALHFAVAFTEAGAREEVDVAVAFCERARRYLDSHGFGEKA